MATTLQDFRNDLPLLVESGLIAIKQGDEESAKKLFNAVGIIDPQNMAKKMGYGLIALHKMDIKTAQKNFNEILQVEQTNWRAQAFLAFSYILSVLQDGSNDEKINALRKGAELSQEVLDKSDAPTTRQLAQSLLDWERELMEKVGTDRGPVA
jgi:tetratricopeptide (TPR) repeat protein